MAADVVIKFTGGRELALQGRNALDVSRTVVAQDWLDDTYVTLGCEPLRPSGKVLLLDRVLAIAMAAGIEKFSDPVFAQDYAEHVAQALQRARVVVDIPGLTVG